MKTVEMKELINSTQDENPINRKARLIQDKFKECSQEQQFKFFKNVVQDELELTALRETISELKGEPL